jgi:phytoene desaturase
VTTAVGDSDYDVIVIGAGLGGLAAGGLLAHRGLRTAIFEQAPRIGGCCGSVQHGDYQFDVGATVVLFLHVIERYFEATGRSMADYVEFLPIEPLLQVVDESGNRFTIPTSPEETGRVFAGISEEDGEGWRRFSHTAETGMAKALTEMFTTPMQTFEDLMKMSRRSSSSSSSSSPAGDRVDMLKSFESTLRSFFRNDSILGALSLTSYSIGLPPALAPGYGAFLGYSEHQGSHYPRGGMKAIPEGVARAFEEDGGEIHLRSPVAGILTEGRRAVGVRLADGREVRARVVIGDINVKVVYGRLLPRALVPRWARWAVRSLPLSQSSAMLMLGLEGDEGFGGHHTLFSTGLESMNRIWFDDYERGRPTRGGYLLASMPSATDASLAPPGHHVVHLHTLAPYALSGDRSWDDLREPEAERMLDFLERDFGVDVRERVRFMRLSTPLDLERDVGLHRGAVYGLENGLLSTSVFRPRMRSSVVDNLYLAGSSVHLGGGIPLCIGSGMIAADMVTEDWSETGSPAHSSSRRP